jgi:hypothetical protein
MAATNRGATANPFTLISPNWVGDCLDPEYLVRGGMKIDNAAVGSADAQGHLPVRSGTILGCTIAELEAGTARLGLAADTDDWIFIVAVDVVDALVKDDVTVTRPGSGLTIKENFLPAFSGLTTAVKAKVRSQYFCTVGVS